MNSSSSRNNPRRRSRRNKQASGSRKNSSGGGVFQKVSERPGQNKSIENIAEKEVLQYDLKDEGDFLSYISSVGFQEKSLLVAVEYIKKFKLVITEEELQGVQEVKLEGPLVPSGKRHSGQGVEDEDQGILFIAQKESGEIVLDITQLVAGFIIGPKGVSVREISNLTGCQMKSWTVDEGGVSVRPCRNFVLSGSHQSILQAMDIMLAAIARYKELAEGDFAGRSVNRIQKIKGVDFFYYPPPKTKVSHAASIQGAPQGFSSGVSSSGNFEQLGDDRFVLSNRGGGGKPTTLSIRKALQLSEENIDDVAAKHAVLFPGKLYTRLTRSQRRSQSRQNSRRARRNTGQNSSSRNDQLNSENSEQIDPIQEIQSQSDKANNTNLTQIIQNLTSNKNIRSIETQTTGSTGNQNILVVDQNKNFEEIELKKILQQNEQKVFSSKIEKQINLNLSENEEEKDGDGFIPLVAPPVPVIEAEIFEKIVISDAKKSENLSISDGKKFKKLEISGAKKFEKLAVSDAKQNQGSAARNSEIFQFVPDNKTTNLYYDVDNACIVPGNVRNVRNASHLVLPKYVQNAINLENCSEILPDNAQNAENLRNWSEILPENAQNAGNSEMMENLFDNLQKAESSAENFFNNIKIEENILETSTTKNLPNYAYDKKITSEILPGNFVENTFDNFSLFCKQSENLIDDENEKRGNLQQIFGFVPRISEEEEEVAQIFEELVSGNFLSEEVGSISCVDDVNNAEKNVLDISGKENFPPKSFQSSSNSVAAVIGLHESGCSSGYNEGSILNWSVFPENMINVNKIHVNSFHPAIGYEVFDKKIEEQQKLLYKLFSPDRAGMCDEENVYEGRIKNLQSICKYLGDICLDKCDNDDMQQCIGSAVSGSCLQRASLLTPPQSPYINSVSGETFFTASSRSFQDDEQTTADRVLQFKQNNNTF